MKSLKLFSFLLSLSMLANLTADDLSALPENGWGNGGSNIADNGKSANRSRQARQPNPAKVKQRDLFLIDGGAVYLKPYQGGTDFASMVSSTMTKTTGDTYGTNKALDFNYDWGFRAGIGYQGGQSRQTLKATYLYLAADANKSTTSNYHDTPGTPTNAIFSIFLEKETGSGLAFGDYFTSGYSKWNLHFNMLDLTFGKKYPKRGCMTFEPFVGLKGILLSENQKSTYSTTLDPGKKTANPDATSDIHPPATLTQKINFKGIGPIGGLSLDWTLSKWISFIGSIDAALLYSSVETKRYSNNVIPSLLWTGSSHDIKGTPVLEGMFALKGVYCWKSGRFIDLRIGFEEHYIFQTMKHVLLNSDSSTDLSLMGWFATIGFGF